MRRCLVLLLLAGCMAEPPELADYVMRPAEASEDCMPTDPQGPDAGVLEEKGWAQNPGPMDNDVFEAEGIQPETNIVALFDCADNGRITSAALWFPDFGASRKWAENALRCDGEFAFKEGRLVGFIRVEGATPDRVAAANATLHRILGQGSIENLCPHGGGDARDPRT